MKLSANGIKVNYKIDGPEGAPWVTFVTGMANDTSLWNLQVPALANDFRILRYDLRGHGQTKTTPGPYSFDLLIDDLIAVWDALGIKSSSLVGLGLGGAIVLGAGTRHSDRIERLVPCCCRAKIVPEFAAIWPPLIEIAERDGMAAIVDATMGRWFPEAFRDAHPDLMNNVRTMVSGADPQGYVGCIKAFLTLDFADDLDKINVPTLFISGANDTVGGPPEVMEQVAKQVKGARHISIPDAAHICNIENAEGFNKVLGDFLRG